MLKDLFARLNVWYQTDASAPSTVGMAVMLFAICSFIIANL
jgi:hypothetical protein